MFRNRKNSSPNTPNPIRKPLGVTAALLVAMAGLWAFGKHEDKKWQRAMSDIRGA